jgi:superfamily II DNA or RNA helicase
MKNKSYKKEEIEEMPKILDTYLGTKGYTINKEDLTVKQQYFIRNSLTVKPYVPGSPTVSCETFPAYRESNNKIYMPRYFGEEHFGKPKQIKISEGNDIEVPFNGILRDYQSPVVNKYLDHAIKESGGGLLDLPCAWGKTSASLYILSQLKKKTIVIVHKEFLMNQWIERIHQFLPSARIGKIQGQIIDIENKDIVLAMLQSLSMKEYPSSLFDSFGLTIIDEVHHISSETFSNALFKLVTKYMLGLSATMNRKDGTTKIFKMFLGDIIEKVVRKGEYDVIVRGIQYIVNDEEFNETTLDYKGNPQFSTMITKLCAYNRRSEFILKVIEDMFKENLNQQIMILAHNKSLLKYLYDSIQHRQLYTVGYYIGGMKEAALKESETKQIIIATYSMAAEALDIKSLTTLIMATPKTDIEQAVGRILREKHSQPVVVDIIDSHGIFQNQWTKRKKFYKSQNYKIIECSNDTYSNDTSKWKTVFEPKVIKETKETKETKDNISKNVDIGKEESSRKNDLPNGICFLKIKSPPTF